MRFYFFLPLLILVFFFPISDVHAGEIVQSDLQHISFGDWVPPTTSLVFHHRTKSWIFNPEQHDDANMFNSFSQWQISGIVFQTEEGVQLGGETDDSENLGNSVSHTIDSEYPYLEIEYELFTTEDDASFDTPAFKIEINNKSKVEIPAHIATIQQEGKWTSGIQSVLLNWTDYQNIPTHLKLSVGNTGDATNPTWIVIRRIHFWTLPLEPNDTLRAEMSDLAPYKIEQYLETQPIAEFLNALQPWDGNARKENFYWRSFDTSLNEEAWNKIPLHIQRIPPKIIRMHAEKITEEWLITLTYEQTPQADEFPLFIKKNAIDSNIINPIATLEDLENSFTKTYVFEDFLLQTDDTIEVSVTNTSGMKGVSLEYKL